MKKIIFEITDNHLKGSSELVGTMHIELRFELISSH